MGVAKPLPRPLSPTRRASLRRSLLPFGFDAARLRQRLHDGRFWSVQAMIAFVTLGHVVVEVVHPNALGAIYFVPASLYLFPVLYASLNFGQNGAFPTAVWAGLTATPNVFLWHHGLERAGEAFEIFTVLLVAVVVASRVDRETAARQRAEEAERRGHSSERRYRSLFENAGEAIVVLTDDGVIQEANAAAGALVGRSDAELSGLPVADVLGVKDSEVCRWAAAGAEDLADVVVTRADGTRTWVQPICTSLQGPGAGFTQLLLRDVTERHGFQRYAREIVQAQEAERERIAQELHDVSVQEAILICRQLDEASDAASGGDFSGVAERVLEARHTAEDMAAQLRNFSRDLRPLILEDLGLVPALRHLTTELRDSSPIRVRFEVTGVPRRLSTEVELSLYRIAEEALRNAQRHAEATHCSVSVAYESGVTRLMVKDNGKGFRVPALASLLTDGHLGILGMQERARLVNGRCDIRSKPGAGTRLLALIPDAV